MGEIHYARYSRDRWEDAILKMKANGINIIATYVFWIHHEETEGVFDWSGNKDLRSFLELCHKHNLWVFPRIGPWCHGEVRNGGLPDWIMRRDDFSERTNDPGYQFYADRLYREIAKQLDGLYYKDGGPIISIQLENEYWRGKKGEEHILWLKQTALKYGMDVPFYTITGWRNTSLPENEVIPLWGGYPAAPWNTNLNRIESNESYVFNIPINDQSIGHKEEVGQYRPDYSPYPYFTCELGVGNQISGHRRPIINPLDGVAIATSSLASGSNLLGYYVFAGGLNPVGKYTTLEEDRLEAGYWNEYPIISYDFQAAIRETGEIAPSYQKLKPLHFFLNKYGNQLAVTQPVVPANNDAPDNLQYSARIDGNKGFLFVSNYYRGHVKSTKRNVQFNIQLPHELVSLPTNPIRIVDSTVFIWPFNFSLGQALLKHATVQLICDVSNGETNDWFFFRTRGVTPELKFADEGIEEISINSTIQQKGKDGYLLQNIRTGLGSPIEVQTVDGTKHRIFILSEEQSEQFWYFNYPDKEYVFLSTANLYMDEEQTLHAFSTNLTDTLVALNSSLESFNNPSTITNHSHGGFTKYVITNKVSEINFSIERKDLLKEADWLSITPKNYDGRVLFRKQFFKNFSLNSSAEISRATFYILGGESCIIRINGQWLNQSVTADKVNMLDLTGYLKRGQNDLMLDFPFVESQGAFAVAIEVEFYNSERILITTDSSWLTVEQYRTPAPWDHVRGREAPEVVAMPKMYNSMSFNPHRYLIIFDRKKAKSFGNAYLRINYLGDKAQCRSGGKLVADNFNNETTWSINLNSIETTHHTPLIFELQPLQDDHLIYFDKPPTVGRAEIISIKIEPEYLNRFTLVENI